MKGIFLLCVFIGFCQCLPVQIGVDWTVIDDKEYYKGVSTKNFNEAQLNCKENGGKLAEPQSEDENDNLDIFADVNDLWIGIKRNQTCTMIYPSNNARVDENWPRTEPNSTCDSSEEITMCASIDTLSTEWIFTDCNMSKGGFICEKVPGAPTLIPTLAPSSATTQISITSPLIEPLTSSNILSDENKQEDDGFDYDYEYYTTAPPDADSDNFDCVRFDQFLCPGTSDCIYKDWLCDNEEDCPGGEDESPEICEKVLETASTLIPTPAPSSATTQISTTLPLLTTTEMEKLSDDVVVVKDGPKYEESDGLCILPEVENGAVNVISQFGNFLVANVTCDNEYQMVGQEIIKCGRGIWKSKAPICMHKERVTRTLDGSANKLLVGLEKTFFSGKNITEEVMKTLTNIDDLISLTQAGTVF